MFEFMRSATQIMRSKAGLFVHAVLLKWYVLVAGAAMVAAYHFLKGLEDLGLLERWYNLVSDSLGDMVNIARHCTPKILDMHSLINCLKGYS